MGTLLERDRGIRTWVYSVAMLLMGISMILPFVFMLSSSFKYSMELSSSPLRLVPVKWNWHNYIYILHHKFYFHWYWNSLRVVGLSILFRGFFVTMAAYAFAKLNFQGKNVVFVMLLSTLMIPGDMTIVAKYLLYKSMHLIDTDWVMVLPAAFDVFFLFLLRQFFLVIPNELLEAATIDGCSHYKIYYRIMLPMAIPALITMMLFTFIWSWNDFVTPYVFINRIEHQLIAVGLQFFQGEAGPNYPLQMAGATIAILPTIIFFGLTQRFFVEGIASSGIKA